MLNFMMMWKVLKKYKMLTKNLGCFFLSNLMLQSLGNANFYENDNDIEFLKIKSKRKFNFPRISFNQSN